MAFYSGGLTGADLGDEFPKTWAEFTWPDWVPPEIRKQIEGFWSDTYRGPREYFRSAFENGAVPMGTEVTLPAWHPLGATHSGKFVFAWNNIGRVIKPDGTWGYVSFGRHSFSPVEDIEMERVQLLKILSDAGVPACDEQFNFYEPSQRLRILLRAFRLSCMNHRRKSHNMRTEQKFLEQAKSELPGARS